MKRKAYLFELSGEHPTLPMAELRACLKMIGNGSKVTADGSGYAICNLVEDSISDLALRLALTHRIGTYLGTCDFEGIADFVRGLDLPNGTVMVRVKRHQGEGGPELANSVVRRVGEAVSKNHRIDLAHPDIKLRILLSNGLHFFLDELKVDRDQFEKRHVRSRPFFSPVSLHPRYARALVNLTRVGKGQTLLDPFCGTGGILLEASLLGIKVMGSDASRDMIEGCKENLIHFGAQWDALEVLDIGDIRGAFGEVDAVATDPPYGRSATTMKEPVIELHRRGLSAIEQVLRPGSHCAIVLPYPCSLPSSLDLIESHSQRVHRSLDRHYCVLKRRAR